MAEEGRDLPAAFYDRPEIEIGFVFYWRAFNDLSTERAVGMGIGPIPERRIAQYAERQGIDDIDEFERFRCVIADLDGVYLAMNAPKGTEPEKMRAMASVNDPEGVKAILGRLSKPATE